MSGILSLDALLKEMEPQLSENAYIFCSVQSFNTEIIDKLKPIGIFQEDEGMTLIVEKASAENAGLNFDEVFNKITLQVHSSLEAVGLTAAVSTALANENISANVVAAYYHDHIFVPKRDSAKALRALLRLTQR